MNAEAEQLTLFDLDIWCGRMSPEPSPAESQRVRTSASSLRRSAELRAIPYMFLDLNGPGNLLGLLYWEILSPWRGESSMLNTGASPNAAVVSSLSQILQGSVPERYYLSRTACLGILRRARERGKELPPQLKAALIAQAGLVSVPIAKSGLNINRNASDMPIQIFSDQDCLAPWDTQQTRIFTPESKAPTLAGADGGGGRNPAGLLFAAGFCAGAGPSAGGIGYSEELAPTLKAADSGTNMVPSILCLNDQGGGIMDLSENKTGTLRSQTHGHQPVVFENHGIDCRYKGPLPVAPTLSARGGTGGNNLPLALQPETICISGNTIDRQPQNGGNGLGCQEDIAYTLTATDHHAVFSRQRVDVFRDDDIASTESARQHKDATDLVCQPMYQTTVGALTSSDHKGPNSQYVGQDKLVVDRPLLIRRLTPLECERLQGFLDDWTNLPGAADSARYRALGNSVAIPCVEYIMRGIAMAVNELL